MWNNFKYIIKVDIWPRNDVLKTFGFAQRGRRNRLKIAIDNGRLDLIIGSKPPQRIGCIILFAGQFVAIFVSKTNLVREYGETEISIILTKQYPVFSS